MHVSERIACKPLTNFTVTNAMPSDRPQLLSVLLEHETGVMEVFCEPTPDNATDQFAPVSSVPCSGTIKATDRRQLDEAVTLSQWAREHLAVFEGKVSP